MKKIKLIAIIGKAGSGKDTILRMCLENDETLNKVIAYSTRPKREKEEDGVEYKFIEPALFHAKVLNKDIIEHSVKNDWWYGTDINAYDPKRVNIGVYDISRIPYLIDDPRFDLTIAYVYVEDKTRLLRQLQREKSPNIDEIIRRYSSDKKDFEDMEFAPDLVVKNELMTDLIPAVHKILGKDN